MKKKQLLATVCKKGLLVKRMPTSQHENIDLISKLISPKINMRSEYEEQRSYRLENIESSHEEPVKAKTHCFETYFPVPFRLPI